jgi:hypothetical protein
MMKIDLLLSNTLSGILSTFLAFLWDRAEAEWSRGCFMTTSNGSTLLLLRTGSLPPSITITVTEEG